MSKMKVYELAKELGKSSKELLEFLGEKNIEVKSHMSSIEDGDVALVKKAFGGKAETTKADKPTEDAPKAEAEKKAAEVPKAETAAPKKKNIVHVFRPQNTRDGGKGGNRQGGRCDPLFHQRGRPGQRGRIPSAGRSGWEITGSGDHGWDFSKGRSGQFLSPFLNSAG